jgi:hypothetical protein
MLAASFLHGQTPSASISGIVTDPSGSVVPGVKVTATDTLRGESYQAQTNQTGFYRVPELIPSTYRIVAEKTGFQKFEIGTFPLATQQGAVLNITLQLGSVTQEVMVTSQAQMVEPSNATLGGLVTDKSIDDLPLSTRNVFTLMALLPGVAPSLPNNAGLVYFTDPVRFSLNGGLESTSDIQLDGISALAQSNIPGIYASSALPSPDGIQEFRVQTNDFSAAYGRSGGGLVTMVTKSGTNTFHGDAYDFFRNDALNANGFFSNTTHSHIAPLKHNDYGATVGGPIVKNKMFFFFTFEGDDEHAGNFSLFTVPSAAERQGNFSQDLTAAGALRVIYNPFSTVANPSAPGTYTRTAFTGNVIPSNLLDPTAAKLVSFYPTPNLPGVTNTLVNNLGVTAVALNPAKQFDARVDRNFSANKRAFARYDFLSQTSGDYDYFNDPAEPSTGTIAWRSQNSVVGYTQTFGTSMVLDLHAGFNRFTASRPSFAYGFNLGSLGAGYSGLATYAAAGTEPLFPIFSMTGYTSLGGGSFYQSHNTDYDFVGALSRVMGRQTLQVGGDARFYLLNFFQPSAAFTGTFTNDMTQGPNPLTVSSTDGDAMASFELGAGDSGLANYQPRIAAASHYFAEYAQDDIKLTRKLTVNLGFRFEEESAVTERYNRLSGIDPTAVNPISTDVGFTVNGGYVFVGNGPDSYGRRAIRPVEYKSNPRFGIAYLLDSKTVIRAGYGIFYGVPESAASDHFTGGGFSTTTPWLATLNTVSPNNLLSNPFPSGFVYPQGAGPGLLSGVGTTLVGGWPQNLKTMYDQQWNFTVQRSFGNDTLLQLAYAGGKGTHLGAFCCSGSGAVPNMDQLTPAEQSLGSTTLLALVTNPFYGYISSGTLSQPTVQKGQLLRPFPEYTSAVPYGVDLGDSEYDALQALFQRRLGKGATFIASYTWSKTFSDISDGVWNDTSVINAGAIRSWYCFSCEHSPSSYDVPNRLVLSAVSALPFGKGEKFGSNWNRPTNLLLGGWQANGILTLGSGFPLVFVEASNNAYSFGGGQHPNPTGISAKLGSAQSIHEWFNTAAFAQPAASTFGALSRTFTAVRSDWTRDLDFSLFKNFSLTEKLQLQFRAEAYNLTNTPVFSSPNVSQGSSSFGIVSGQSNTPRQFQLALKLIF